MGDNPAEDTLQFTLSSVADVNAYLALMNCGSEQLEPDGELEKMDEWVEEVDS